MTIFPTQRTMHGDSRTPIKIDLTKHNSGFGRHHRDLVSSCVCVCVCVCVCRLLCAHVLSSAKVEHMDIQQNAEIQLESRTHLGYLEECGMSHMPDQLCGGGFALGHWSVRRRRDRPSSAHGRNRRPRIRDRVVRSRCQEEIVARRWRTRHVDHRSGVITSMPMDASATTHPRPGRSAPHAR